MRRGSGGRADSGPGETGTTAARPGPPRVTDLRGGVAVLSWSEPGPVRLERCRVGGSWETVRESVQGGAVLDTLVHGETYRYILGTRDQ